MNHKELTEHAKFWLKSAKQCNPVFSERGSQSFKEMPDAIGFTKDLCIVVECKTSKSDLYADRKKPFRESGGLGNLRYYFVTEELYQECVDFDWRGWGVILHSHRFAQSRQVKGMASKEFESNIKNERDFLRSRILEVQRFGS